MTPPTTAAQIAIVVIVLTPLPVLSFLVGVVRAVRRPAVYVAALVMFAAYMTLILSLLL